jgi:hypothetical protein
MPHLQCPPKEVQAGYLSRELSRKVLGAPSPGRLSQGDFAATPPRTGAESVFKDFPEDL